MDLPVVFLVLLAAICHAGWNAIVKINADRLIAMTLVATGSGLFALAALPFVPRPAPAAWPYLAVSIGLHTGYMLFLLRAYAHGDLGHVYPLARGTAPLIVTLVSVLVVGEHLAPASLAAVLLLTLGVCSLAVQGGRLPFRSDPRPVLYALGTSAFIAAYTVTDGLGARLSGSAHSYAVWLFALEWVPITAVALVRRRRRLPALVRASWPQGLAAGAMSLAAYWLVIWAMTEAPMAPVAALRETSVVFAAVISAGMLKERFTGWRAAATLLVVAGVAMLRL